MIIPVLSHLYGIEIDVFILRFTTLTCNMVDMLMITIWNIEFPFQLGLILLPQGASHQLCWEIHYCKIAGHFGGSQTPVDLQMQFYRHCMLLNVETHIWPCDSFSMVNQQETVVISLFRYWGCYD
jgi:hypothetical protein